MDDFLDKITEVIQDLEVARDYALSVGLDTMALRFHESTNKMLDLQEALHRYKIPVGVTYNNSDEIAQLIANQLAKNAATE